jgi:sn-1 stearoyl-lipid 9-desaturase
METSARPSEATTRRRGLLLEPTFGHGETTPRRPTLREVLAEWFDAVNFVKDRSRLLPAVYFAHHLATGVIFVYFFLNYFSVIAVLSVMGIATFIGTIYNTVWYHRYCTHRAYKFRNVWFARILLWTNPAFFREESYVIPHRIHHSKSDEPGDPYGPHLGWLGSYLATESSQRTNRDISAQEYDRLAKTLEHIGFTANSYEAFRRTGSVENVWHYALRMVFSTFFWCSLGWLVAGLPGALAWLSGVFFYTFLVRDFNYRGHGGFFFKASKGLPANQIFYGIIAGEWHDNHHAHPRSARAGIEWWQIDVPYAVIKTMHICGMVVQVNTHEHRLSPPRVAASEAPRATS